MTRSTGLLIAVFMFGLSSDAFGAEPSFDCDYAEKSTEKAICDHQSLIKLDQKVLKAYTSTMRSVPAASKSQVRWEQRAWIMIRNKCGYSSLCIEKSYQDRMERLTYWRKRYPIAAK